MGSLLVIHFVNCFIKSSRDLLFISENVESIIITNSGTSNLFKFLVIKQLVLYFLKRYKKNNVLKNTLPRKGFNDLCFLYRSFIFFPIFTSNVILSGSGSGNCNSISSVFLGELDFTVTKMLSGFKEEE